MSVPHPGVSAPDHGPGVRVYSPLTLSSHGAVPADHQEAGVGRHKDAGADPVTLPGPQHLEYEWSQTGPDH